MRKKAAYLFLILLLGGLGGLLTNMSLYYLSDIAPFSRLEFIKNLKEGTTIINKTEEIVISKNEGLQEAILKIQPSLVGVVNSVTEEQISGFVLTSDGLIVSSADILTSSGKYLIYQDSWQAEASLVKKDLQNNLALFKIEKDNLSVVSLGGLDQLSLGQMVILNGLEVKETSDSFKSFHFINLGTVRSIKDSSLAVNLSEKSQIANGGPLIDIEGRVIGLNLVNSQGFVKSVPVAKISQLLEE